MRRMDLYCVQFKFSHASKYLNMFRELIFVFICENGMHNLSNYRSNVCVIVNGETFAKWGKWRVEYTADTIIGLVKKPRNVYDSVQYLIICFFN